MMIRLRGFMSPNQKKIHIAKRASEVTPFLAMEVMERAKELEASGREVIYLCLGEPDFPTPVPIVAAAVKAPKSGRICSSNCGGRLPNITGGATGSKSRRSRSSSRPAPAL